MTNSPSTIAIDHLEDTFLAIAEGDRQRAGKLERQLAPLVDGQSVSDSLLAELKDNVALIVDDDRRLVDEAELRSLIVTLAGIGVDSMPMRDALAAICRKVHSHYPDPAGLIRALGVLDGSVAIREVHRRWRRFGLLNEDVWAWHDSYGLGRIAEIDGFSDLYVVQFAQRQSFNLVSCLTALSLVTPGSLAEKLLIDPPLAKVPASATPEFVAEVAASFVPPLRAPWPTIEAIIVPRHVLSRNLHAWRQHGDAATTAEPNAGGGRSWAQARSLDELKLLLANVERLDEVPPNVEHLARIFRFSATRKSFREVFAETLAMLDLLSPEDSWMAPILEQLPEDTFTWTSLETFSTVTSKLKAKLRPGWLRVSRRAKGLDWFLEAVMSLPLRFWSLCEDLLVPGSDDWQRLREAVTDQVRRGSGSADAAMWLWSLPGAVGRDAFSNPSAVFRILSQPVSGDHIKARKDLFSLLMDSNDFQACLMRGGSDEGIQAFVRAIKTSSVLQKGEQQSLLVKIVRIFPQAKEIVEERQEVVAKRPMPKVTSYRSMKERHTELQEIINKKIPANSAAIAHARSYGDLRENAEFKAAKDEQRYLMARRAELERDLKEITPTDFSEVVVGDAATPGMTVELIVNGKSELYHILGLWDSVPERHIISYETPLGRKLIGQPIGAKIEISEDKVGVIASLRELPDDIRHWVKLHD